MRLAIAIGGKDVPPCALLANGKRRGFPTVVAEVVDEVGYLLGMQDMPILVRESTHGLATKSERSC